MLRYSLIALLLFYIFVYTMAIYIVHSYINRIKTQLCTLINIIILVSNFTIDT